MSGTRFVGARNVEEGVESGEGTGTLGRMLIVSSNPMQERGLKMTQVRMNKNSCGSRWRWNGGDMDPPEQS